MAGWAGGQEAGGGGSHLVSWVWLDCHHSFFMGQLYRPVPPNDMGSTQGTDNRPKKVKVSSVELVCCELNPLLVFSASTYLSHNRILIYQNQVEPGFKGHPIESIWIQLDLFGPIWTHWDLFETSCIHLDPYRPKWTNLDPYGPIWTHLDQFGAI